MYEPKNHLPRRLFVTGALAGPLMTAGLSGPAFAGGTKDGRTGSTRRPDMTARLRRLENQYSARVGLTVIEPSSGDSFSHRGDERFALCSTFKTYAVASVLDRFTGAGPGLDEPVYVDPADIVENSPKTDSAKGTTVTLGWLCEVALTHSDNTAGNYLLRKLGGPRAIGEFARMICDPVTRLDRWEPELNTAYREDLRDTSTPTALAHGYRRILLGRVLAVESRRQITDWMKANVTSGPRMRAGLPAGWTSADKTGAGGYGTLNDVGVVWDASGQPLVLSILTDTTTHDAEAPRHNELIADVTEVGLTLLDRNQRRPRS